MKKITEFFYLLAVLAFTATSCDKVGILPGWNDHGPKPGSTNTKQFPGDVALSWYKLEQKLISTTPGFGPGPTGRAFGYSGLVLYESVIPGMPAYQSLYKYYTGNAIPLNKEAYYFWPASANTAMACFFKKFFSTTSAQNLEEINQLEALNNTAYAGSIGTEKLQPSIIFGKAVAEAVFAWSKTDGALATYPAYVPPIGPGLWIPTPPALAAPVGVYTSQFRPFSAIGQAEQPGPPISYSADPASAFYQQVNQVYTISKTLTHLDSMLVKHWGDIPGNKNGPAHFTQVLMQLVEAEKLNLETAAFAFAKHGFALNDAGISVFTTKYKYNVIRPVSYINNVMVHPEWATIIPTPPHPEYPAAHATTAAAVVAVLETIFGKQYAFTDRTHEALYGAFKYSSLKAYGEAAGWSRVLGGIHYAPSVEVGLWQGKAVGAKVNQLPFKKNP